MKHALFLAISALSLLAHGAPAPQSILGGVVIDETKFSSYIDSLRARGCSISQGENGTAHVGSGCFDLPGKPQANIQPFYEDTVGLVSLQFDKKSFANGFDVYLVFLKEKYGKPQLLQQKKKGDSVAIWYTSKMKIWLDSRKENPYFSIVYQDLKRGILLEEMRAPKRDVPDNKVLNLL